MRKITFSIPFPLTADETREMLSFTFQVSLVSYLGFYLIESLSSGFVIRYYSLDLFLWSAVVSGVASSILPAIVPAAKKAPTQPNWKDFVWMVVLALGTTVVIWYKAPSIGWLVTIIAPLSGLIVLGLSLLVYYDQDNDPEFHK